MTPIGLFLGTAWFVLAGLLIVGLVFASQVADKMRERRQARHAAMLAEVDRRIREDA